MARQIDEVLLIFLLQNRRKEYNTIGIFFIILDVLISIFKIGTGTIKRTQQFITISLNIDTLIVTKHIPFAIGLALGSSSIVAIIVGCFFTLRPCDGIGFVPFIELHLKVFRTRVRLNEGMDYWLIEPLVLPTELLSFRFIIKFCIVLQINRGGVSISRQMPVLELGIEHAIRLRGKRHYVAIH